MRLLELSGETGWFICNNYTVEYEEGELTYTGNGYIVIGYILAKERIGNQMNRMTDRLRRN